MFRYAFLAVLILVSYATIADAGWSYTRTRCGLFGCRTVTRSYHSYVMQPAIVVQQGTPAAAPSEAAPAEQPQPEAAKPQYLYYYNPWHRSLLLPRCHGCVSGFYLMQP